MLTFNLGFDEETTEEKEILRAPPRGLKLTTDHYRLNTKTGDLYRYDGETWIAIEKIEL